MTELRWILLAAGALALLLIYLQGRRKRSASVEHATSRSQEAPQLSEPVVVRRREAAIPITIQSDRLSMDDLPEVHVHSSPDAPPPNGAATEAESVKPLSMEEALSTAA